VGGNLTNAGAICFEAIPVDCVSWGGASFIGANNLPDDTTPSGSTMPTGLLALRRNITANCATALDAADDTNNANADFALLGASPTPNSATPVESLCAASNPPVTKKKKKCKKGRKLKKGKCVKKKRKKK
jgi:hypothetical protein